MDFKEYVRTHLTSLSHVREPEILDELAQHLADLYEEGRAAGLSHDDALARAVQALPDRPGDLSHAIESASRAMPPPIARTWDRAANPAVPDDDLAASGGSTPMMFLSDLRRDLRYATRMLARTPGFVLVVVLTLSLGIGANTAIFSAINAIVLRSAPVADPNRVVTVYMARADGTDRFASSGFSYPDYTDLRDAGAFEGLAAFAGIAVAVETDGTLEQVSGEIVSGNYFDVLGIRFARGRGFRAEEDRPGSPVRVVVVSNGFWNRRMAGDQNAVGRNISINGAVYTIVGVTPPGFTHHVLGRAPELFVPMALQQEVRPPSAGLRRQIGHSNLLAWRGGGWLNLVGRLRGDATHESTAAALNVVAERAEWRAPGATSFRTFTVVRLGEGPGLRTTASPILAILGGAVMLVLLIACANVAGLLAARAVSRRREVAIRLAVGASRGRLVRQWLTESVLLALMGSAGAVAVALWMTSLLYRFGLDSIDLSMDRRVFAFTLIAGVLCGLLFGIAPVLQALRRDTLVSLRDEGGAIASGARAARMRSAFVVFQVALGLILLVGAGLFLRTVRNAYAVDPGYSVDGVLLSEINLDLRGYSQDAGQDVYRRVLDRLKALPGVQGAGASRVAVLSGGARTGAVSLDGRPVRPDGSNGVTTRINVVNESYLAAMGIPLLSGRGFEPSDSNTAPRVAIVSLSLTQRVWPGRDPIGQTLIPGANPTTVIGVVPDVVYRSVIESDPHPFFLLPLSQNYESGVTLHVRGAGDPLALLPAVRQVVREIDPLLVVARPRTLEDELARSLAPQRLMATFVGIFAALALLLAAIGLYGLMAHATGERRAEIGIRLALGARPVGILSMVIGSGLRLVAIGLAIGLAGAIGLSRIVERQLFGVTPGDPTTYAIVALVLTSVAIAACFIPARRAMRVDPVVALRS